MDSLESLRAGLSEVMVHVFVHQLRPLLRSQPPKKAVGMRRATLRAIESRRKSHVAGVMRLTYAGRTEA